MNDNQKELILNAQNLVKEAFDEWGDFGLGDLCDIEDTINDKIKTLFNEYYKDSHTPAEWAAILEDRKTWVKVQDPPTYHYRPATKTP